MLAQGLEIQNWSSYYFKIGFQSSTRISKFEFCFRWQFFLNKREVLNLSINYFNYTKRIPNLHHINGRFALIQQN